MQRFYVYVLIDPRNGETFYVGKGTGNRMFQHVYSRNHHRNASLGARINSILAGGLEVTYEKILFNVNEDQAFAKEIELILEYGREDLLTGSLLNRTSGGEGVANWSAERRLLKSEQEKAKQKGKPVSQYGLDGMFISTYSSAKVASESVEGANRSYITQVCKGKRKSAGGFMWTYKGDPKPTMNKMYWKEVQQFTLEGYLIDTYRSLTEAQQTTGVELHNISECCRGKSKTAGRFIWRYVH